jgi:hypothetical protein
VKEFAENLRHSDISGSGALSDSSTFVLPGGISGYAGPHLTNLKAKSGSRTLTGYPSDV